MKTVNSIREHQNITLEELSYLLSTEDEQVVKYLKLEAQRVAQSIYGRNVFIRGLIEISSYCRNDCFYCGLRRSNTTAVRYRLTEEEIYSCCEQGYELGFRTFVMQGGEDPWFNDDRMCRIIATIRNTYPDCAITLSLGERSKESYQRMFDAGANRYLLRHETAIAEHYSQLHPLEMSWQHRVDCLYALKEVGYQVGCGFMVGSPKQTFENLFADLQFIRTLQPAMVGIGPFIPAHDTPFANQPAGTADRTVRLLAIIRLLHPRVLLPATTALGTIYSGGRELGILSGANVIMPNLSPKLHRKDYSIYDNKLSTGDEAAESRAKIDIAISKIGYQTVVSRGDYSIA